jgi:sterol desaturase/sphingolipid hydroxylase (fatty acid hydroxylase superfamily)
VVTARAVLENGAAAAVVLPALLLVEALIPPASGRRSLRGRRGDIAFVALVIALTPVVTIAAAALSDHGVRIAHPIAAAFVVGELGAYWVHRLEHRIDGLWRFHAVHHRPAPVDALAGFRFHPVDIVLQRGLPIALGGVLGISARAFVPYLAVVFVVTALAHVNADIPASPLDRIVATPAYHRAHHDAAHQDANLALAFPVLDAIFGTQRITNRPIANDAALATNAMPTSSASARR